MTENKKKRRTPQEMEMARIEAELAAVRSICAALLPIAPEKREWALKAAIDYLEVTKENGGDDDFDRSRFRNRKEQDEASDGAV